EREIDTNMEAIEDAENIIHPLLEKNDIDEEVKKQAINVKAQLDHSKIYYKWLAQLSEALESGEIFNYFPIPDEQHHHDQ
ncbi:MAG: GbsR/MarR family transcriptional regulator, partial [Staphylococcus epidermidis]|nr:GbsR/MarR family transcriptional regulator [Staphylococcus epidermidis]